MNDARLGRRCAQARRFDLDRWNDRVDRRECGRCWRPAWELWPLARPRRKTPRAGAQGWRSRGSASESEEEVQGLKKPVRERSRRVLGLDPAACASGSRKTRLRLVNPRAAGRPHRAGSRCTALRENWATVDFESGSLGPGSTAPGTFVRGRGSPLGGDSAPGTTRSALHFGQATIAPTLLGATARS